MAGATAESTSQIAISGVGAQRRTLRLWPKCDTQELFGGLRRTSTIVAHFLRHKRLVGHGRCTNQRSIWGDAMRDDLELGIPDTAPYKEWLGVVGSMLVAALVGIVLYSGAFLT